MVTHVTAVAQMVETSVKPKNASINSEAISVYILHKFGYPVFSNMINYQSPDFSVEN